MRQSDSRMDDGTVICSAGDLKKMVVKRLAEAGMPEEEAACVADVLVYADLRGVYSHGVLRVPHYAQRIRAGGINLSAKLCLVNIKPSIGLVDAQGAAGHVATTFAAREAIRVAHEQGLAMVGIKNNTHCGALAYYVQMALNENLAALVCVNTDKQTVPFGSREAFFGTNPFAFGFPGEKESILIDMATSEVAWGKVLIARERNQTIPEQWAVDLAGNRCSDPRQAVALLPFGGSKGYCIMIMVEALTGLMIGGVFGPHLKKMYGDLESYRDISTFILTIDPAVFGSADGYLKCTQRMIDELHALPPAPGFERVMIPGEIERLNMERSRREGIPVPKPVYNFLSQ
jgi:ureidoglycolate dehydrogenase (NAD+)